MRGWQEWRQAGLATKEDSWASHPGCLACLWTITRLAPDLSSPRPQLQVFSEGNPFLCLIPPEISCFLFNLLIYVGLRGVFVAAGAGSSSQHAGFPLDMACRLQAHGLCSSGLAGQ